MNGGRESSPFKSKPRVTLDGKTFIWTGQKWLDEGFLKPPDIIIRQLNALLEAQEAEAEAREAAAELQITDTVQLAQRARYARECKHFKRAEKLARRLLKLEPNSPVGATLLCAALRDQSRPQQAIEETNRFLPSSSPYLLTSRAAAFCDLGQWVEAKKSVGQALAMKNSGEAQNVVMRIKAARPDLYE